MRKELYDVFTSYQRLRIYWKLSTILKTSNKWMKNVFWYVKVYIFWKFIQYNVHWGKTHMSKKKNPSEQIKSTRNVLFIILRAPTHHSFTFDSYTSCSRRFISLKVCVGFSVFDSVSLLLSLCFCSIKSMDSSTLNVIIPFKIKIIEK